MATNEDRCAEAKRFRRIDDAFRKGDLAAMRAAVDDPAVIPNGRMPDVVGPCLVYAIYHSPLPFIRTLLELSADPNTPVLDGFPPRRHGAEWYAGSMTNGSARELSIPLHFAGSAPFLAEIYSDDPSAPEHPEKLRIERIETSGSQTIRAILAPAGGHVIRLTPLNQPGNRR